MTRINGNSSSAASPGGLKGRAANRPRPPGCSKRSLVEDLAVGAVGGDRPLQAPGAEPLEAHPGEFGGQRRDLIHHVARTAVAHLVSERAGHGGDDVEVGPRLAGWLEHRLHELDPPLGVRERAFLFEEGRRRQDHVRVGRGLVGEDVLADEEVERLERAGDVCAVGVGLGDVLAEDVHRLQLAGDGGVEHLRHLVAGAPRELDPPGRLEAAGPPARRSPGGSRCGCRAARPCRRSPGRCSGRAAAAAPSRGRPTLPVSMARLQISCTTSEPYLCSVTPRPQMIDASVASP